MKGATVFFCFFLPIWWNICALVTMECIEINWLCKHMKKVRGTLTFRLLDFYFNKTVSTLSTFSASVSTCTCKYYDVRNVNFRKVFHTFWMDNPFQGRRVSRCCSALRTLKRLSLTSLKKLQQRRKLVIENIINILPSYYSNFFYKIINTLLWPAEATSYLKAQSNTWNKCLC